MFDIDKVINEANKKIIYGEKPELPKKIEYSIGILTTTMGEKQEFTQSPTNYELMDTINKIIDYLEWENK